MPCVGRALKLQGHPQSQLQLWIYSASKFHFVLTANRASDQLAVRYPNIRCYHHTHLVLLSCRDWKFVRSVVGPVGFEPTTSGPDFLGVTSAPGSPSQYGTLVSFGRGYDPWTKLDDGPTKNPCIETLANQGLPNRDSFDWSRLVATASSIMKTEALAP